MGWLGWLGKLRRWARGRERGDRGASGRRRKERNVRGHHSLMAARCNCRADMTKFSLSSGRTLRFETLARLWNTSTGPPCVHFRRQRRPRFWTLSGGYSGVVAWTSAGSDASDHRYASCLETGGMLHALCVGINEHANGGLPRPHFARQDAEDFASVLTDRLGPGCQTTVLVDRAATKSAIAHAVTCELPHRARPADAVILFFAGLGCTEIAEIERPGFEPSIHLVAHDTDDDRFVSTSINLVSELSAWIRRLPVSGVFLVLDASFTGEPGGRTVEGPRLRTGVRQRSLLRPSLKKLPVGETCAILTACDDDEIAREAPELGHGVFTHHLLQVLGRGAQDAALSLGAMHREVRLAVEHTSGNRQSPVLIQGPRAASPLFRVRLAGAAQRAP